MEVVIVTGMSGAGKSRALDVLEDMGFYCVDNMPPCLLPLFAEQCLQGPGAISKAAIGIDIRSGELFRGLFDELDRMKRWCPHYTILFLDCDDSVLNRRYKETRRRHPLAGDNEGSLSQSIAEERRRLQLVRDRADYLVDTSLLSTSQLHERITCLFLKDPSRSMAIECISFGFKYGYPAEADFVLDVRCLPNPYYVDELKNQSGLDQPVRDFVLDRDETKEFQKRCYALLDYLLPLYRREGKSQLVIAVGCTGGRHRSVALAEELAKHIKDGGHRVAVHHRDMAKL